MAKHPGRKSSASLSYHSLRRAVGIIALFLPFVLIGGDVLLGLAGPHHALPAPVVQRSISDYRYTPMGDCLVGSLCTIAAFLMCSRGYGYIDELAGYLSGIFALGVALCPSENPREAVHSRLAVDLNFVHTVFAALMFLSLAFFCLVLFRRSYVEAARRTRRKRHRNMIYATCGWVILGCNAAMLGLNLDHLKELLDPINPLLTFESLAMIAFGVAWLVKGEGILKDRPHNHMQHNHVAEMGRESSL